ncbi:MAG: hypothetical protein KY464_14795 [Gemmatimonadetes bacterium]|nr:hypothetical protein [Gemmatimonadota bacterium]
MSRLFSSLGTVNVRVRVVGSASSVPPQGMKAWVSRKTVTAYSSTNGLMNSPM